MQIHRAYLLQTIVLVFSISHCRAFHNTIVTIVPNKNQKTSSCLKLQAGQLLQTGQFSHSERLHRNSRQLQLKMTASEAADSFIQFLLQHPLQDLVALVFLKFTFDASRDGASLPVAFTAGCIFISK